MRLGAPLYTKYETPDEWVKAVQALGYRSAYCPVRVGASSETVRAYAEAAAQADIVIAEVGIWRNPLSRDEATQKAALEYSVQCLSLAEEIGAKCCVNIAGSRGEKWDGPCADDLTEETFALIVETTRQIIDAVNPKRTFYTLEPMPWMYPDSTDSYLRLIEAIDRPAFGVHFDPVNIVNSPSVYFRNGEMMRDFIHRLGHHIRACHLKDILLRDHLTVHLDEVTPGQGTLDYRTLLTELAALDPDLPILLEHLPNATEYDSAAAYVRKVAEEVGVPL
jgi:sugar phosphate isomerase/epimerase